MMKTGQRITHDFLQGSPEWLSFRQTHFGASEAAAMLGLSKNVKRTELLHMKHTGTPKEFSDWVQKNILDYGHEIEGLARPIIEGIIGDDLYPMVFSLKDTRLSASTDGIVMSDAIAWENKQRNQALFEAIRRGELPEEHMPQAQQVLMVSGADRLIFSCSDGTHEGTVMMEVLPDESWFQRIRDGWAQFERDLAEYVPRNLPDAPQAEAIMALPALAVQIRGEVIASNLPAFKSAAERFIASIKTDLTTDEDFVQADATVKFCEKAEKDLEVAKNAAIAQTASIDELMRTVDHIKAQLRDKRLSLDKLVAKRKDEIKAEIIAEGRNVYAAYVASLNAELEDISIQVPAPDFIGAAKNKRTLASLHDAIDSAVANGKIAADAAARDLRAKLQWYAAHAEHAFLFRDLQALIQKPAEDFELAVTTRIAAHNQAEAEKIKPVEAAPAPVVTAPAPAVRNWTAPARVTPVSAPTLRLGVINERLAPITLTAEGLAMLGFAHAATDKNAKLFHEAEFPLICVALIRHIEVAAEMDLA